MNAKQPRDSSTLGVWDCFSIHGYGFLQFLLPPDIRERKVRVLLVESVVDQLVFGRLAPDAGG